MNSNLMVELTAHLRTCVLNIETIRPKKRIVVVSGQLHDPNSVFSQFASGSFIGFDAANTILTYRQDNARSNSHLKLCGTMIVCDGDAYQDWCDKNS